MTLTRSCPAKVNLALSIGSPDARGFHPIASWMVALEWGDTLSIVPCDGPESRFDIAFAADAPQPQPIDWPLEKDLAFRAHRLMELHAGRKLPVTVTLRKRVPAGAGLGGGSSDAAAMLVMLNDLFELGTTRSKLASLAGQLGSDVSFALAALQGEPSAIVTGFGECIEPAGLDQPLHLVLIVPPLQCPTGKVYAAFDQQAIGQARLDAARVRSLAAAHDAPTDQLSNELFNDLAQPAMRVAPELTPIRDQVREAASRTVHVTGSGAALFVLANSAAQADELAERITARTAMPAVATRTL